MTWWSHRLTVPTAGTDRTPGRLDQTTATSAAVIRYTSRRGGSGRSAGALTRVGVVGHRLCPSGGPPSFTTDRPTTPSFSPGSNPAPQLHPSGSDPQTGGTVPGIIPGHSLLRCYSAPCYSAPATCAPAPWLSQAPAAQLQRDRRHRARINTHLWHLAMTEHASTGASRRGSIVLAGGAGSAVASTGPRSPQRTPAPPASTTVRTSTPSPARAVQ